MPPRVTRRTTSANVHDGSTVRQTIVETLEAPRLTGIATADFLALKQTRTIYERRVQEKSVNQGIEIPTTSYRKSMENPVLKIFVTAQWVPVSTVNEITKAHLKQYVDERASVKPEEYDLAQIERGINDVKLGKSKNLEMEVWKLGLHYATTLENLDYFTFIESQPKIGCGTHAEEDHS